MMNETDIDKDPLGERVPIAAIVSFFPELTANPFAHQLCKVFSSDAVVKETLSFEDFLDMASVLSEAAPIQVKADWAFRVFGIVPSGAATVFYM
jgi:calcium and integrin-binding protein 1